MPPIVLRPALRVWHRVRGLGWYNFEGTWSTISDVPVTPRTSVDDPWAATLRSDWRENLAAKTAGPIPYDAGPVILPLLACQMTGPFTVLDFAGGAGIGLATILKYTKGVEPSNITYVLIETPAVARMVRSEIKARHGQSLDEIPTSLAHPLIVHAGGALQVIPDYQSALDRLIALKPELLAPKPQRTPCDAGLLGF